VLAQWVREGGALVVVDDDHDPYCAVREWWNTAPLNYKTPREHLFEALGIPHDASGLQRVGRGVVVRENASPAALTYTADGAEIVRGAARRAAAAIGLEWSESNALVLRRGPYVVAAALDESTPGVPPAALHGRLVNLFDAELPVMRDAALPAGTRALFLDLDAIGGGEPRVLAAACRVRDESFDGKALRFRAEGIAETQAVVRIAASARPKLVTVGGASTPVEYDAASRTALLRFSNSSSAVQVEVGF
jgi:hypothetical protein